MNDAQYLTQVTPEAPVARRDLVNRWVYGLAIANVIAQLGYLVTDGMVRVAKQGLTTVAGVDCTTWPDCPVEAEGLPFAGFYTTIDVLNWVALLSVLVLSVALAAVVVKTKPTKRRPQRVHAFAALPVIMVLGQAVLGLVAAFAPGVPWLGTAHTAVFAVLIAVSAWLVNRLISPDVPSRPSAGVLSLGMAWVTGVFGLTTAALGIVATNMTDAAGEPLALPRQMEGQNLSQIHTGLTIVFLLLVLAGLVWAFQSQTSVLKQSRRAWVVLFVITLAQAGLGITQLFLTLSPGVTVIQLLGAGLAMVGIIWVLSFLYTRIPVLALAPATRPDR